jgi:chitinase
MDTLVPPDGPGSDVADASDSGGPTDASADTGQWVMGYYAGYAPPTQYPIDQIDWAALTHIIVTRFTVNSDLSINTTFDISTTGGPTFARNIVAAAHAHGVRALVMLGGEGAGANIQTAARSANRSAFVSALLAQMTSLGFDGIDLDWEDSVTVSDLVALAQALRAAHPGIVLTYPAGMINGNFMTVDPMMVTLAASLDRFNVQAYGPSTAVAGPGLGWDSWHDSPLSGHTGATPIAIDDTLQRYAMAGIPRAKLGLGIGFFAECYTNGITAPHQPADSSMITGGDNTFPLSALFATGSVFDTHPTARMRDTSAQVPYLSLASATHESHCGTAAVQYITYDDETSIAAKGAFSRSNGYGGIII